MIQTRREGDVHTVVLNRAEKRNALTPGMLDDLHAALGSASRGDARAMLLAGEGPVFCGGFDLELCSRAAGTLEELLRGLFEVVSLLRGLPIPVVVAAHGAAIAGGCALLGGADVVVTNREARLGYPVTPLGISPAVSAPFLRLAIGEGPCRTRLLEPTLIPGAEALRLGLVDEAVDTPAQVRPRAAELAATLAAKPRSAMQATRLWLTEVEAALAAVPPRCGLDASLALAGGEEERTRLAALFG